MTFLLLVSVSTVQTGTLDPPILNDRAHGVDMVPHWRLLSTTNEVQ